MEFINNRYQVLSVLEGGPFGPMFRVRDSLRHDHRLLLQLPGTGNDLSGLFSRLEDDFIRISQLSHPALARYRHFGRVVKVDGMPAHSGRFFLTCDDVPLDLPFREAIRQVGPRAAAVLVCRLAAAMRYLHDRGFIMGALNERTLRFFRVDGKWEVRLVGLPLPAQSRPGSRDHRQDSETANLPEHVDNGDMEALGELLLRLAAGFPAPRRGVAAMHAEAENRWDRLPADAPERLVLALVERMLGLHGDEDRPEPDAVIRALNSAFGLQEPLFDVASNQRILHHVPLQDRTGRMASMIAEGIRRLSGARGLFTQGICGDRGAGKTRNCEELQFRCEMRGFPVYRTELAEGGDVDPFPSLVRVLLPDASAETIHQYGPELVKLLPDNPLLRACRANPPLPADQEEKRMRTRVLGFVEAVVKEHPAVLVFDDLNRFPQERLLWIDSLLERLRRHSAWVVFAWDGIELAGKARELLNRWEERFGLSPEWLPPFGPEDTARFITMSLGLPRDAMAFSRHVHEETDGNPARIRGLLYTLRHDGLLHLDENGHWSTRFDGLRDYSHLKPDSTYEKALEEAYARLEPTAWRLRTSTSA